MREYTENDLAKVSKSDYNRLQAKYKEQQKILKSLKLEEKLEIREKFKHLTGGRKRKYTPLRMKNRIIDYLAQIAATSRPPTISGLMAHLKMHRDQWYAYQSYPEFKDIMEQTKNVMENWYEESLVLGRFNGTGIQFALKNRFGWTDTQIVKNEMINGEDMLIRKIEALAPEIAGFFQRSVITEQVEYKPLRVVEGEFTDQQYEERGNE
jgi:hypothetical protein